MIKFFLVLKQVGSWLLILLFLGVVKYLKVGVGGHLQAGAVRHFEKCNPLTAFKEILSRSSAYSGRSGFFLNESCVSCSKPECDFASDSCVKKFSYLKRKQFSPLVEFAINAGYFPKEFTVLIKFDNTCAIALEFSSTALSSLQEKVGVLSGIISECVNEKCKEINSCKTVYNDSDIFSFAFGVNNNSEILLRHSKDPNTLATSDKVKNNFIFRTSCKYNSSKGLTVGYAFDHSEVMYPQINQLDGIPVVLPCSRKGFPLSRLKGKSSVEGNKNFDGSTGENFNAARVTPNLYKHNRRRPKRNIDTGAASSYSNHIFRDIVDDELTENPSLKGVKRLFNFFFIAYLKENKTKVKIR
ncbi:UNVERIFIED_CONTAM: hypothetical protein RMT77_013944 [Armadillidium vulgare]